MSAIFNYILSKIKEQINLFLALLVTFLIGFILGLFFTLPTDIEELYKTFILQIFTDALLNKAPLFSFVFTRVLNLIFLYLIAFLLGLNSVLFFGVFLLVFYKAVVMAVGLKIAVISLSFLIYFPYIFTVFLESLIVTFSLIIYAILTIKNVQNKTNCFLNKQLKITLISFSLGLVGIAVEVILLTALCRPINFYF